MFCGVGVGEVLMSLYDYFTGQQSWSNYVSNRDVAHRFDQALRCSSSQVTTAIKDSGAQHDRMLREGFGSLQDGFEDCIGDLRYDVQDISQGIDRLRGDFHILMGDAIWKLEIQNARLASVLAVIQAPL